MADVSLEDLLDRIRPECSQAPTDLLVQKLRDTIRDFCQMTRAWQYEVEGESIGALVSDYDIETPSTSALPIAVEFLMVDGTEAKFQTPAWLDANIANWRYRSTDDFRYFTQLQPKQITFPCVPTKSGTLGGVNYRVSLKPTVNATVVDQTLSDEWIECWSDGAIAKLKYMNDKPWGDAKRAATCDLMYRDARGKARIRIANAYGNATQRWVGPKFAGR